MRSKVLSDKIARWAPAAVCGLAIFAVPCARAQDNYEIQVYGSDMVGPRQNMLELHSNFTIDGSKTTVDGMLPTNHVEHETIEITHGIND